MPNNVDAKHWKRLRDAFMRRIVERDFIGCLIVQEIMLESFATASYARVDKVATGSLGKRRWRALPPGTASISRRSTTPADP